MSPLNKIIFTSKPFQFIVDGTSFYLPSALVTYHSRPFERLINGPMSEAQKGCVELKYVDEGTFLRFSQWAYEGFYVTAGFNTVDVASPKAAPPPKRLAPEILEEEEAIEWSGFTAAKKPKKGKKAERYSRSIEPGDYHVATKCVKLALKEGFCRLRYPLTENAHISSSLRANPGPAEDCIEVFLSHARIYVFAEKYDIQPLKALAIHQLHKSLAAFTLYKNRIGDIVALLRYSYANTADLENGTEQLRALLMRYIETEMEILIEADEFTELLAEKGVLLHDFLKVVGKRLSE